MKALPGTIAILVIITGINTGSAQVSLLNACERGDLDSVKTLVEAGADVNYLHNPDEEKKTCNHEGVCDHMHGRSPLFWAIIRGHHHIAKYLLSKGANPNLLNEGKKTALHWAVLRNDTIAVNLLISYGALPDAEDTFGKTPLDYARAVENEVILVLLANSGKN